MGPAMLHPQPPTRVEKTTIHCRRQLEPENDARVVAEVALVVVAFGKIVAEASQKKVNLRRPNSDGFAQGDVEPSANEEIKGIVARGVRTSAISLAGLEEIAVTVRMSTAKQRFHERFKVLRAIF